MAFGSAFSKKPPGNKNKKGKKNKESDCDIDAELLGLSATATALAASSDETRPNRRRAGEIFASRPRRADTYSSGRATTDEDWEDSEGRSISSANSGLAFGGDSSPGADSEESSDSGKSSGWGWGWGSKNKDKKKAKKDKKKNKKGDKFPTAPLAAGAAAAGAAALYSHKKNGGKGGNRSISSSPEGLRHIDPIPASDPSQFEPSLVRPGDIPLQQPQPVTPVSQAVYSTQGESIPAYMAAAEPPPYYGPRQAPAGPWDRDMMMYNYPEPEPEPERNEVVERAPGRRDSSPSRASAMSGSTSSRRRSMPKDQGSVVQFDLTREQEDRQRRADLRDERKRESSRDQGIQLVDHERDDRSRNENQKEPSLVGPAVAGAIGAAATSSILSRSSDDGDDKRRQESRERRRTQRRTSDWDQPAPHSTATTSDVEEKRRETGSPNKPVHKDYAAFFAPEELKQPREAPQPIIHQEPPYQPALRTYTHATQEPSYPGYGLPWPVPQLNLIEPTPPHSHNGSVRDDTSPIPPYQGAPVPDASRDLPQDASRDIPPETSREVPEEISREVPAPEEKDIRRPSGSRVSWGPHQMHEYEVPSENESVDENVVSRELPSYNQTSEQSSAHHGIEFAATLAAGAAAAGFDPNFITDDPSYMRSGPETTSRDQPIPSIETGGYPEAGPAPAPAPEAKPQEMPLPLRVKNISRDSPEVVQSPSVPRERPRRRPRELAEVLNEPAAAPAPEPFEKTEPVAAAAATLPEQEPREAPTARSTLSRIPVKGEKRFSSGSRGLDDIATVNEDRDGKDGSDKENQPAFEKV